MPKRVADGEKRVALNCLVKPETLEWLRDFNGSQGEAVDAAVAVLRGSRQPSPNSDGVLPVYTKRATVKQMEPEFGKPPEPRRLSKKDRVSAELAASDLTAQVVGRDDIEYGHHDTQPRGEHVANLRPLADERQFKSPIPKPKDRKK